MAFAISKHFNCHEYLTAEDLNSRFKEIEDELNKKVDKMEPVHYLGKEIKVADAVYPYVYGWVNHLKLSDAYRAIEKDLGFPSKPDDCDIHTYNDTLYIWNGDKWCEPMVQPGKIVSDAITKELVFTKAKGDKNMIKKLVRNGMMVSVLWALFCLGRLVHPLVMLLGKEITPEAPIMAWGFVFVCTSGIILVTVMFYHAWRKLYSWIWD